MKDKQECVNVNQDSVDSGHNADGVMMFACTALWLKPGQKVTNNQC